MHMEPAGRGNIQAIPSWNLQYYLMNGGQDSVVGIATCYGFDLRGLSNTGGDDILRTNRDQTWGPPSLVYHEYQPGVNLLGCGIDQPPPSMAGLKKD
jgi:hypothetical protein